MTELFNQEAEEYLLSILIRKPHSFALVELSEDDFGVHGWLFSLIHEEYQRHGKYTVSGLMKLVQKSGNEQSIIMDLRSMPTESTDLDALVSEIKGYSDRRKVNTHAHELIVASMDRSLSHGQVVEMATQLSQTLVNDSQITYPTQIIERMRNSPQSETYSTGIPQLDDRMGGGMASGRVYGLAGAEKGGKTMLASTISYNLSEANVEHLYVCMEMGDEDIYKRMLARKNGFNASKFLKERIDVSQLKPTMGVRFLDCAGIAMDELENKLLAAVVKLKVKGIIIDYWQLIRGQGKNESEEKHLRSVAQRLADFAKKHRVWVLVLSQMNEDGKTFAGRGLGKACDQLYSIHNVKDKPDQRWLKMNASRYTFTHDIGSETDGAFVIDKIGPHMKELK
jgi:replicative DNA helicase